jgi:hypothetical protein
MRFLESARRFATSPFKLLLHKWLVEVLGEYSKVVYLISANLKLGQVWWHIAEWSSTRTWKHLCKGSSIPSVLQLQFKLQEILQLRIGQVTFVLRYYNISSQSQYCCCSIITTCNMLWPLHKKAVRFSRWLIHKGETSNFQPHVKQYTVSFRTFSLLRILPRTWWINKELW